MDSRTYRKNKELIKFTTDEKRRLIQARIENKELFKDYDENSMEPWYAVSDFASLNHIPPPIICNQWNDLIAAYRELMHDNGFSDGSVLNEEAIHIFTQEWEHFRSIHNYVTSDDRDSQTYELPESRDYGATPRREEPQQYCGGPSLEHDYFGKQLDEIHSMIRYILPDDRTAADLEEDSEEDSEEERRRIILDNVPSTSRKRHRTPQSQCSQSDSPLRKIPQLQSQSQTSQVPDAQEEFLQIPVSGEEQEFHYYPSTSKSQYADFSERDKYYRHKRRYNHRNEKRFNAVIDVLGQISRIHYPEILDNSLIEWAQLIREQPSSSDDDDNDDGGQMC